MIYVVQSTRTFQKILYAGTSAKKALIAAHLSQEQVYVKVWNKDEPFTADTKESSK